MKFFSILYLAGIIVIFFSLVTIVITIISDENNGNTIIFSIFAILNGLIAIGIADILKSLKS